MATIREWLDKANFDWATGEVVFQSVESPDDEDWGFKNDPGCTDPTSAERFTGQGARDHKMMAEEFGTELGAPRCPRFIAQDKTRLFFPGQYDGSTWLETVHKDLSVYLDFANNPTPYVGG